MKIGEEEATSSASPLYERDGGGVPPRSRGIEDELAGVTQGECLRHRSLATAAMV